MGQEPPPPEMEATSAPPPPPPGLPIDFGTTGLLVCGLALGIYFLRFKKTF